MAAITNAQKGTEKSPVEQGYFTGADGVRLFIANWALHTILSSSFMVAPA
jgi:hypothetical protein